MSMNPNETPKVRSAAEQMGLVAAAGPFGRVLIREAEHRKNIVGVSADLAKYTDMQAFADRFPKRFFNVGMAEQNLISVAAGLASAGLVVVATSFAAFATRRPHDFTLMQVALPNANVKLIGAVPGVTCTFGPSHASFDDLAIMRGVPGMVVFDPCDAYEAGQALDAALAYDGPVYIRQPFSRPGDSPLIDPQKWPFRLGEAVNMRTGNDVGIVAMGFMVGAALEAAEILAAEGISAEILKVSTLKPFDATRVAALAAKTHALVTAENHSVIGGLFSAVAETLARIGGGTKVVPIGIQDEFPMFGSPTFVSEKLGMTAQSIVCAARAAVDRGNMNT